MNLFLKRNNYLNDAPHNSKRSFFYKYSMYLGLAILLCSFILQGINVGYLMFYMIISGLFVIIYYRLGLLHMLLFLSIYLFAVYYNFRTQNFPHWLQEDFFISHRSFLYITGLFLYFYGLTKSRSNDHIVVRVVTTLIIAIVATYSVLKFYVFIHPIARTDLAEGIVELVLGGAVFLLILVFGSVIPLNKK